MIRWTLQVFLGKSHLLWWQVARKQTFNSVLLQVWEKKSPFVETQIDSVYFTKTYHKLNLPPGAHPWQKFPSAHTIPRPFCHYQRDVAWPKTNTTCCNYFSSTGFLVPDRNPSPLGKPLSRYAVIQGDSKGHVHCTKWNRGSGTPHWVGKSGVLKVKNAPVLN